MIIKQLNTSERFKFLMIDKSKEQKYLLYIPSMMMLKMYIEEFKEKILLSI
jgi:hypothetical protein